jgi:L-cystine transport system substrate-binding protein
MEKTMRRFLVKGAAVMAGLMTLALAAGPAAAQDTVRVGTEGTYAPFTYQDDSGKLTGYDVEVLRLVEAKVPDLKFEFVPQPWDSMFLGLEAGKYDVVANEISKTPERETKYLFSDVPYFYSGSAIIVKKGVTGIHSLDDLKGKVVGAGTGSEHTKLVEDYLAAHPGAFEIRYYDGNVTPVLLDLAEGRIDAHVNDPIVARDHAEKLGLPVEATGDLLTKVPAYFVFRQDAKGQALKAKIDAALTALKADGSLAKLSVQWTGKDYTAE